MGFIKFPRNSEPELAPTHSYYRENSVKRAECNPEITEIPSQNFKMNVTIF